MDDRQQGKDKGKEGPEEIQFVDKRRFKPEEVEAASGSEPEPAVSRAASRPTEPPRPTARPSEAGPVGAAQRPRAPEITEMPDVYTLLSAYIATLGSQAFVWMGLLKDPISGKIAKDMAQARVAIDTCEFLAGQIEPKLGEGDRREMQRLLADLKVNFVRQSGGK